MINLLPYTEKKLLARIQMLRTCTAVFVLFAGFGLIALLLLLPTARALSGRYAAITQELSHGADDGSLIATSAIDTLAHRVAPLTTAFVSASTTTPVLYMDTIASVAHANTVAIHINRYAVTDAGGHSVEVGGTATTRAALQNFIDTLRQTASIARVDSPVNNFVKSTNVPFTITIIFS